jgi:hypothetical protein
MIVGRQAPAFGEHHDAAGTAGEVMIRVPIFAAGLVTGMVLVAGVYSSLPAVPAVSAQTKPQTVPPVYGVWQVVEQSSDGKIASGSSLGLGFHIYTPRYFAVVRESGTPPRPQLGGAATTADTATAAQLLAAWGPLVAQVGTYELAGDLITERVLVAKDVANMQAGSAETVRRYRLDGNTLTIEPREAKTGGVTLKLIRVE